MGNYIQGDPCPADTRLLPAKLKLLQNADMAKDIDQLHTLQLRGYCSRNGYLPVASRLVFARTLDNAVIIPGTQADCLQTDKSGY